MKFQKYYLPLINGEQWIREAAASWMQSLTFDSFGTYSDGNCLYVLIERESVARAIKRARGARRIMLTELLVELR